MSTTTTNIYLTEPAYGDTPWNTQLNTNFTLIDNRFGNTTPITLSNGAAITITFSTSLPVGSYNGQVMRLQLQGSVSTTATVTVPSGVGGMWIFDTSGMSALTGTVTIASGGAGTSVSITTKGRFVLFSDGTNINYADDGMPQSAIFSNITSTTFTAKGSTSGTIALTATAIAGTNTLTLPAVTDTLAGISAAQTLTNKRIDPRVNSTTSSPGSVTPDISSYDIYAWTAQAATLTLVTPTGSAVDGDKLMFRIKDNGTSRTISWDSGYRAIGVTLPTATTAGKVTYVGCIYNANSSTWDAIAVTTQA